MISLLSTQIHWCSRRDICAVYVSFVQQKHTIAIGEGELDSIAKRR